MFSRKEVSIEFLEIAFDSSDPRKEFLQTQIKNLIETICFHRQVGRRGEAFGDIDICARRLEEAKLELADLNV